MTKSGKTLIMAPSNLGLRPHENGSQQGTWRAPDVLMAAGLVGLLQPSELRVLPRPKYSIDAEPGTRIRNAGAIRRFSFDLADEVKRALNSSSFPIVVGGDCSNLLGCLFGASEFGRVGLVHIDGHSDYFHPGNYDSDERLGSVAGMDLALSTGRGEPILTDWPHRRGPLVEPADAFQIGERDALSDEWKKGYSDIERSNIERLIIQDVLAKGTDACADIIKQFFVRRGLTKVWLHIDFDVLDQSIMPAVDSPGSPGLDFGQLEHLVQGLMSTGKVVGIDFAIYDPELDQGSKYARRLAQCIANCAHQLSATAVEKRL